MVGRKLSELPSGVLEGIEVVFFSHFPLPASAAAVLTRPLPAMASADLAIKREVAADAAVAAGRKAAAIPHFERAIALHERQKSTHSVLFVDVLYKLGASHRAGGNNAEALRTVERALQIAHSLDPDDRVVQVNLARCGLTCGAIYAEFGRNTEAIAALNPSLALHEQLGDTEGLLMCVINVARLYESVGRAAEGLEMLYKAKTTCLSPTGGAGPSAYTLLYHISQSIGGTLMHLHRFSEAVACYKENLALIARTRGRRSREAADVLSCLADAESSDDNARERDGGSHARLTEITEHFLEALSIIEEHGLQSTKYDAALMYRLGCSWGKRGNPAGALYFLQRAVDIARKVLPPDHPLLAKALSAYSAANELVGGREDAAAAAHAEALAIDRRSQVRCAGPGCTKKLREDGAPLDVCVKCRRTFYCGKACQTADWKREGGHKAECKALIAARAAAEKGSA